MYSICMSVIILAVTSFSNVSLADEVFYYYFDKKVHLQKNENEICTLMYKRDVNLNSIMIENGFDKNSYNIKEGDSNPDGLSSLFFVDSKNGDITSLKNFLSKDKRVKYLSHAFKTNHGNEIGVTPYIIMQFNPKTTQEAKKELLDKYNLTIVKSTWYIYLKVPDLENVFDIANALYESGLVRFSHPDFFNCIRLYSDTWYNKQFQMHNTGQIINDGDSGTSDADVDAPEAWAITTGSSSIVIALIDDGVEAYGYDIPSSKLEDGSNFGSGEEDDPSPQTGDKHGQSCAGIIIAQHNNYGIRGIAPGCKLMPIRIDAYDTGSQAEDAIMFAYKNGADVISCSWGLDAYYSSVVAAMDSANTYGRGGKGAIMCIAASNSADHDNNEDGIVSFPADRCIYNDCVLSIGASNKADSSANYSPWPDGGDKLSVVAPSGDYKSTGEVWTTDRAYGGYNPDGSTFLPDIGYNYPAYTGRFNGTSAACPLVAGIAALVLSVNSSLDGSEVVDIICDTAEQVGDYDYIYHSNNKSKEFGHGRVNACNAVTAAGSPKIAGMKENTDHEKLLYGVFVSPLPANPSTKINYTIAQAGNVSIAVYSVSGQKIATLVDGFIPAGTHAAVFDGSSLASGLYLYRFEAKGFAKTGKIVLVK